MKKKMKRIYVEQMLATNDVFNLLDSEIMNLKIYAQKEYLAIAGVDELNNLRDSLRNLTELWIAYQELQCSLDRITNAEFDCSDADFEEPDNKEGSSES